MMANEQLKILRSEVEVCIRQQFDHNLVQFKALATEIAKSTFTARQMNLLRTQKGLANRLQTLEDARHEPGSPEQQLEAMNEHIEVKMTAFPTQAQR